MIEVKEVEVRDRATFMPFLAIRISTPLARRAGYNGDQILFLNLETPDVEYDPFNWNTSARTVPKAHNWLRDHWEEFRSGDVLDVEFIEGETTAPKTSEIR